MYTHGVPKLWKDTIEAHRQEVGDAILDTTVALVREQGVRSVTMSQIAERVGIGRATLYKYHPDVESILVAWHERHAGTHLATLARLRAEASDPVRALETILGRCALMMYKRNKKAGGDLAALVHQDKHVIKLEQRLHRFIRDLIAETADAGGARTDVSADELASYCLHALTAASSAQSESSLDRLVSVTLDGVKPQR